MTYGEFKAWIGLWFSWLQHTLEIKGSFGQPKVLVPLIGLPSE